MNRSLKKGMCSLRIEYVAHSGLALKFTSKKLNLSLTTSVRPAKTATRHTWVRYQQFL